LVAIRADVLSNPSATKYFKPEKYQQVFTFSVITVTLGGFGMLEIREFETYVLLFRGFWGSSWGQYYGFETLAILRFGVVGLSYLGCGADGRVFPSKKTWGLGPDELSATMQSFLYLHMKFQCKSENSRVFISFLAMKLFETRINYY
jgi:hypothetical protein